MNGRILIDLDGVLDVAPSLETEAEILREIYRLADELNSALPEYEVTFTHLDTANYLAFAPREPENFGEYWEADQERREAIADEMLEAAQ